MATLKQKIAAEQKVRELLELEDVPVPDEIEYGETCIRLLWHESKIALVVDIDAPDEGIEDALDALPDPQRPQFDPTDLFDPPPSEFDADAA